MPIMREPRQPNVSGDTIGPNSPNRIDPMPGDYRGGDTVGAGDRAGRKRSRTIPPDEYSPPPWPVK